jgi:NAD(P)-dependent dehydrogenase (short-subunit alcohol dehydrogenase family)
MAVTPRPRLALVTGASTGIGAACARRLGALGFDVLAGVRRPEDAERLAAETRLEPILLDVCDPDAVAGAARRVGDGGLDALVNNAGIAITGPVEGVPLEQWRLQFEVNLLGAVSMIQALLPALVRARGRIVNMSALAGRVAGPLLGPYASSKWALEGLTDVLRRELGPLGVHVVSVQPGGVATPIWGKGLERSAGLLADMPTDVRLRYEPFVEPLRREGERLGRAGLPPEAVAAVVARAVTAKRPRTRHLVGPDARVLGTLAEVLPDRAMDALLRGVLRALARRPAQ